MPSLSCFQVLNCIRSFSECSQRVLQALCFGEEESKWARQSNVRAQVPAHCVLPSGALLGLAESSWNQVLWGSAHFLQPGCMKVSVTAASMMAVMMCEVCVLRFLQGMWLSSQHSLPLACWRDTDGTDFSHRKLFLSWFPLFCCGAWAPCSACRMWPWLVPVGSSEDVTCAGGAVAAENRRA